MSFQYGGKDLVLLQYLEERLKKDPGSAFFAMLSYFYLEIDKVAEALSIAQRGVIAHPNYSTGHAVLAMAMMRAGFYRDAKRELLKAADLHPGSKMIESLQEELVRQEQADSIGRKIAEEYRKGTQRDIMKTVEQTLKANPVKTSEEDFLIPGIEFLVGEDFSRLPPKLVKTPMPVESPEVHPVPEEEVEPGDLESRSAREIIDKVTREFENKIDTELNRQESQPEALEGGTQDESAEFDLDALARELDSAGPLKPEVAGLRQGEEDKGIELTPEIATDTLAMIFEQQGRFTKAIEAYSILLKKKPDRADYYRGKIAELERRADAEQ